VQPTAIIPDGQVTAPAATVQEVSPITIAIWLGSTKQVWRNQAIDINSFQTCQIINFWRGGSLVVKAVGDKVIRRWEGGKLIARTVVTNITAKYGNVDLLVLRGELPTSSEEIEWTSESYKGERQ
jgi:hypothetical protein